MSLFAQMGGKRQTFKLRDIASASYTTLVPAQETVWTLDSLWATNDSGSAATFILETYDGTNATVMVPNKSIAANDYLPVTDHHVTLEPGEILRVKAGTNAVIDVTAVGIQAVR